MKLIDYKRSDRLAHLIKEEIALTLQQGINDPRIGFVTITKVKVSDDLSLARVYFSVYGDNEEKKMTLAGLKRAKGYLRRELGKRLKAYRRIPDIVFCFDDSIEHGSHIESIIERLKGGR